MIFRSFYARISLLFLLLVLILGTASLMIAFNASRHLFDEVEQLLNREYAASIAGELEPIVGDPYSESDIKNAIHYMMVLNPMVEIYILSGDGRILSYFAGGDDRLVKNSVDLTPLELFRDSKGFETVLGDDPRSAKSRKPFSAAPLSINGEPGWVYVILRGESYDHSLALVKSNYYTRSGLFTFFIALVITLVIGLFLFFVLTGRLRKLSQGVQAFKKGRYDHRIDIRGGDELAQLSRAFNDMADSVRESMEKLKEAERQRSELIANISHDLRSPLTSIRGHLETMLLRSGHISEQERSEFLTITLRNVTGFQKLVEELLDLARLEARQISPERLSFSPAELVQDVVLKVKPLWDEKSITIEYLPDPGLPPLVGDIGLIERALTNILENAIEHTPEKGTVKLSLKKERESYILSVADTGEGIAREDLPRIFDRFYRADKSRTRKSRGTGLGLAIAKEVAELHGGTLSARNADGGGAVFTLTFPAV